MDSSSYKWNVRKGSIVGCIAILVGMLLAAPAVLWLVFWEKVGLLKLSESE